MTISDFARGVVFGAIIGAGIFGLIETLLANLATRRQYEADDRHDPPSRW